MFAYWTDTRSACCGALIVERPRVDCFAGYLPSFACYRCDQPVPRPDVAGLQFESLRCPEFIELSWVVTGSIRDVLLAELMLNPRSEVFHVVRGEAPDKEEP